MLEPPFAGRYRLVDRLGEGSNAVVWRALDTATGQHVAIKRLRGTLATSEEWRARLRREGRAIGTLRHPGVVRVDELGEEAETGAPYLVMELLRGETLAARLARRGRLLAEEAVPIVLDLLDALGAVHAHGLVHRDVKPANVLLAIDPRATGSTESARVTLLDFGLACLLDGQMRVTREGARIGTPVYMSPEQARGVSRVDARADLWGVGGLLYELVTGRPPFRSASTVEQLHAILAREPLSPRAIEPDLPPMLEVVVLRALEKRPQDRYASAAAMAAALRALVAPPRGVAAR